VSRPGVSNIFWLVAVSEVLHSIKFFAVAQIPLWGGHFGRAGLAAPLFGCGSAAGWDRRFRLVCSV
jgi:hypothetical protein